ncbi:hypothetical protein ACFQMM_23405 [Saliphagus sp. GCM10025308]
MSRPLVSPQRVVDDGDPVLEELFGALVRSQKRGEQGAERIRTITSPTTIRAFDL